MIKRIIHKARNHRDASKWDVLQQVKMTPEQRQEVAQELKKRYFGNMNTDVREKPR